MTPERFAEIKVVINEFYSANTPVSSFLCDELATAYEQALERIAELESKLAAVKVRVEP